MSRILILLFIFTLACTSSEQAKKKVINYSPPDPFSAVKAMIEQQTKVEEEKEIETEYLLDNIDKNTTEKIIVDGYDAKGQNPKIKELQLKPYPLAKVKIEEIYSPTKYLVQENETLYEIVKKFNISFQSLIELNQLRRPYKVFAGQSLILPQPIRHKVENGQTLSDIAKIHSVFVADLIKANKLDKDNIDIIIGQEIMIPAKFSSNLPFAKVSKFEGDFFNNTEKDLSSNLASDGISQNSTITTEPRLKGINQEKKRYNITNFNFLPSVPQLEGGRFARPVEGRIVEKFGKVKLGMKIQGVTFVSQQNMDVFATENGVVVYTDDAIKSYGNMIIIKHSQNYTSAYGHLANYAVKRGDRVKKGQVIANLSSGKKAGTPRLYFEIRKNTTTINPETMIAAK